MGMFCNLFIYSESLEDVKNIILNTILREEVIRPHDRIDTVLKANANQGDLDMTFDTFTIFLRLLDEEDRNMKSNMYGLNLNSSIYFGIFSGEPDWENQIMKFIGCIMHRIDADCIFEYYGVPVMIRKSGQITIDESRSGRLVKFPYEELNLSYIEGDIVLYE